MADTAEILEAMEALTADESSFNQDEFNALQMKLAFAQAADTVTNLKKPRVDFGFYAGNGDTEDTERAAAFNRYLRTGDKAIAAEFAQSVGTPSAGGFTAPPEFRNKLVDRIVSFGGIASAAETITTENGNDLTWVTLDDTANKGEIVAEGGTPAGGADLVFGEESLGAYKYMAPGTGQAPLAVTVELLQDSAFDIEALIVRKLGERIARKQAEHFATGDGSGEPLGLVYGNEDLFDGGLDYEGLVDVVTALDPGYLQNASWVMNHNTLGQVRKIVDLNGRPLWAPATAGLEGAMPGGTLLGYPVVLDQAMPNRTGQGGAATPTGNNAIAFGDIREAYVIRRVRDIQLVVNPFSESNTGKVLYTVWARADATVQNPNAYVVVAG